MVLGQLDRPSLAACTLLSRQDGWHISARVHLFQKFVIRDRLKDHAHNLAAFLRFLDSGPFPHTIQHTKYLFLRGEFGNDSEITSVELTALISRFPALVCLDLERVWLKVAGSAASSIQLPLISLQTLRFRFFYVELRVDNENGSVFAQCSLTELLNSLMSVKTFDLHGVEFTWHSVLEPHEKDTALLLSLAEAEGKKLRSDFSIENLSIVRSTEKPYMFLTELFKTSAVSSSLRQLVSTRPTDIPFFSQFVSAVGQNVQQLEIYYRLSDRPGTIHFPDCRALNILRIVTDLTTQNQMINPGMPNISRIVAAHNTAMVAPPTITKLILEFVIYRHFVRETKAVFLRSSSMDWDAFDLAFSTRQTLKTVKFVFKDVRTNNIAPGDWEGMEQEVEELKKRLPRLRTRRRLEVECIELFLSRTDI